MNERRVFGEPEAGVAYTERVAAYVVIINDGMVALVRSGQKHFLPGGGSLPGESAETTILREACEELGQGVRVTRRIGEAIQYFYSAADDVHYRMLALFFAGEFTFEACGSGEPEHELYWLPVSEIWQACFHDCHAWAVREALLEH